MSNEFEKIEEPSIGLHLAIGLSIGTGVGTILAPSICMLIGYAVYRRKYRLYMKSRFTKVIPTDF